MEFHTPTSSGLSFPLGPFKVFIGFNHPFQSFCSEPRTEVFQGKGYGVEVDLWSLGIMLFEFAGDLRPWFATFFQLCWRQKRL